MKMKEIMVGGRPFCTYVTADGKGDELKWYQALDTETLVDDFMTWEEMALDGDIGLRDVPQGRMVNYEMGSVVI